MEMAVGGGDAKIRVVAWASALFAMVASPMQEAEAVIN